MWEMWNSGTNVRIHFKVIILWERFGMFWFYEENVSERKLKFLSCDLDCLPYSSKLWNDIKRLKCCKNKPCSRPPTFDLWPLTILHVIFLSVASSRVLASPSVFSSVPVLSRPAPGEPPRCSWPQPPPTPTVFHLPAAPSEPPSAV